MDVIDNALVDRQTEFLSGVKPGTGAWHALEVTLPPDGAASVASVARKLELALGARGGAILLETPGRLVIFSSAPVEKDASSAVKDSGCGVMPFDVTAETLGQVSERLQKAAGPSRRETRSVLFRHRVARKRNVIMVADDDKFICEAMKSALQRYGECVVAHDLGKVLDTYLDAVPDCVFLDLHLAGGTSLETINAIIGYDKDAHIVMLTGDNTASQARAAKSRGAKSFVAKPIVLSRVEYELFRSATFRRYA